MLLFSFVTQPGQGEVQLAVQETETREVWLEITEITLTSEEGRKDCGSQKEDLQGAGEGEGEREGGQEEKTVQL